jgi:membrane fusion protein (multidrug efflux system)
MIPIKPRAGATLAVLALGALPLSTAGCSSSASAQQTSAEPPAIAVESVVVEARAVPKVLALPGTLRAFQEAEVAADQAGRVVATFIERGDPVRPQAPLVRLDSRAASLSNLESRARASALAAEDKNAAAECQRAEQLFRAAAIARAEYDKMSAGCAATRHSVDAARARQKLAEQAVGDAVIRAPFAGRVAERRVTVGEYVTAGTKVATVVDLSKLRLELEIPESATAAVRSGLAVTFSVAAFPDSTFRGSIVYIGPVVERGDRAQLVEALVENADERLRPGMFATSELELGRETMAVIPLHALAGTESSRRVFVVKAGRLEERVVLALPAETGSVAVKKGLAIGERVVLNPTPALRDGLRVK